MTVSIIFMNRKSSKRTATITTSSTNSTTAVWIRMETASHLTPISASTSPTGYRQTPSSHTPPPTPPSTACGERRPTMRQNSATANMARQRPNGAQCLKAASSPTPPPTSATGRRVFSSTGTNISTMTSTTSAAASASKLHPTIIKVTPTPHEATSPNAA